MARDEATGRIGAHLIERILLRLYAGVLALIGLALGGGGAWLITLGGSPYYLVAGALILVAAVMLWRGRRLGAWLYGAALGLTVIWAIWEVGLDGWELLPRLFALTLLGAWLLLPWTRRPLSGPSPSRGGLWVAGGAVASVLIGLGLHAAAGPPVPADPKFQTGTGPFPAAAPGAASTQMATGDWPHVGGDQGAQRFSPLSAITPANVSKLQVAWTAQLGPPAGLGATPVKVGDRLYTCTNRSEVFALDAITGRQIWRAETAGENGRACRGVAYYRVPGATGLCAERVISGTAVATLVAFDAPTGKACPDFGSGGVVDLLEGLSPAPKGYYRPTSAPMLVRGKVVLGGWVSDNQYWGAPSGVVRAFDAVTGKLAWAWDMGRPDRTGLPPPGETYTHSTPNSWAPMSADEQLGLVYFPTGNASGDIFGGLRRPFDEKYSSSVIAVDADTGRLRWSYQTKHHDLWDHDIASPPSLVDLPGPNGVRKALIQGTKQGEVFVLDRTNGQPISKVVETPMPTAGAVPDERISPTQPLSVGMPSFRGPKVRESDTWGLTPLDQLYCRIQYRQARYEGVNTPPGLTPSLNVPSTFGALNNGGVSVDPIHGVMVLNSNRFASYTRLITRAEADRLGIKPQGDYSRGSVGGAAPQAGTPYGLKVGFWLSPIGVPCLAPPYGHLSAVDIKTGHLLWTQRFGTAWGSGPFGWRLPIPFLMGAPNHGGSAITQTGVVFIGATRDQDMHAYDLRTGKLLWRARLPAGGQAAPLIYTAGGRQFVVISAGGVPALQGKLGSSLVAYALPPGG